MEEDITMSQYSIIESGASLGLSDATDSFRYVVVSGKLYLRETKTELGFGGVEGIDWENIESYTGLRVGPWRMGVRSLHYVLDRVITTLGFSGFADIDWEQVESHKLAGVAAGSPFTADTSLTVDSSKTIDSSRI